MTHYAGQNPEITRCSFDGPSIFTEEFRSRATRVIRSGVPDIALNGKLRQLAGDPHYPSHQAQYFLAKFAREGITTQVANYDVVLAEAWRIAGRDTAQAAAYALENGIVADFNT